MREEEGRTGFSKGWQGCSNQNPEEKPGLPVQGKSRPFRLFPQIYIFLKYVSVLDILKCWTVLYCHSIHGSVLALLNPYWPS